MIVKQDVRFNNPGLTKQDIGLTILAWLEARYRQNVEIHNLIFVTLKIRWRSPICRPTSQLVKFLLNQFSGPLLALYFANILINLGSTQLDLCDFESRIKRTHTPTLPSPYLNEEVVMFDMIWGKIWRDLYMYMYARIGILVNPGRSWKLIIICLIKILLVETDFCKFRSNRLLSDWHYLNPAVALALWRYYKINQEWK